MRQNNPTLLNVDDEKLFRFRGNIANEETFFRTGRLYIPTFQELNDPYDGLIHATYSQDSLSLKKVLDAQLVIVRPDMLSEARAAYIERMIAGKSPRDFQTLLDDIGVNDFRREWKVLSFATSPHNELLWAHYAACHRGICLQFDILRDSIFNERQPVIYASKPPIVTYPSGDMIQAVLTKSISWSYENEFRIIRADIHSRFVDIKPEALTGVIFGVMTSDKDKTLIKKWIQEGPMKPHFFKTRLKRTQFEIEIIDDD